MTASVSSRPIAFVTGATGFVGASVARLLLDKGFHVRALSRPANDRRNLQGLDLEIIEGDLADAATYRAALNGCEALFHVAADYRIWVPDADAMHRINVDGTCALMQAAQAAGIKRMVYTSSVATLGARTDGISTDEATAVAYADMIGTYKRSKFMAEAEVQKLIDHDGLQAVIVNPSTPIGPRDIKPTPTGRIIVDAVAGRMPAYLDTGLNVAHVEDIAMGHWLAYEKGKVGERYILGGENMSLARILTVIADYIGQPAPRIKLPRLPLFPVAYAMEAMAKITGQEPRVTVDALRMAKKKMYFSTAKAERDLGYSFRPAQNAITDAIDWFRHNGYC